MNDKEMLLIKKFLSHVSKDTWGYWSDGYYYWKFNNIFYLSTWKTYIFSTGIINTCPNTVQYVLSKITKGHAL